MPYRATMPGIAASLLLVAVLGACAEGKPAPAPTPVSESQLLELRDQQLAYLAQEYHIEDPPHVDLIRWITMEEMPATTVACMDDAGYTIRDTGDGGIDLSGLPDAQRGQNAPALVALWTCGAEYTIDPRTQLPLDNRQLRLLYDYFRGPLTDCLRDHGIDVGDAPSFPSFVDGFSDHSQWTPWNEVGEVDDFVGLNQDCPQQLSSDELYGPLPPVPGK